MTCHRPGARHCSCAPEPLARGERLVLTSRDPRAAAALRALAAPLEVEVASTADGVHTLLGDVGALLVAAAGALPVEALVDVAVAASPAEDLRPEPLADLPRRAALAEQLERELGRQRPGTTTGVLFCALDGGERALPAGAPSGPVIGVAAARLRRALRRSDTLAHCGGGRFVAVLADLPLATADEVAARAAAAVRASLDEPVATASGLFPLQPVVGVHVHPGGPADGAAAAADVLAAVDRALGTGTAAAS